MQNVLKDALSHLSKVMGLYVVGVAIVLVGLIVFNWHLTIATASEDVKVFWQGIGNAIAVFGFSFIFNKAFLGAAGIDKEKKQREREQKLVDEISELKKQNALIIDELKKIQLKIPDMTSGSYKPQQSQAKQKPKAKQNVN